MARGRAVGCWLLAVGCWPIIVSRLSTSVPRAPEWVILRMPFARFGGRIALGVDVLTLL
jgi:hypothetical protein